MLNTRKEESSSSFQFKSLSGLCKGLGANKVIRRLLIANNGLAAVKGIESIKAWLYEHIGDAEAIHHVVMATPEDLSANAEFISMSDQHFPAPGGPNYNNYANVDLIMRCAMQHSCDAIYPGWGHASENPALPRECDRSQHITFLGPSEDAMFALGDKIASTIVAQSNGVPTVPWSGDSIILRPGVFDVDPADYEKAYITSADECVEACRRIGFPVMIKASEGGGGKGIRCCTSLDQVKDMFFAVSAEVKGCHIFAMRMLENIRHLEVQLLADSHGNCIAVRTRDCSVQRRHQKIIEEGPAFEVDPRIIEEMEKAAIRLAKAVRYRGLGTVEYMYDKTTHQFFFLELNPRIQVEHPVSEMISGVNLPAALLCVGMGIRLDRIPEVRVFYGEEPYGSTPIDFENRGPIPPKSHVIAVRITAEDTEEGFRPSSGHVEEILFKNSQECWGYFSISSGGSIHQFADSQFGHIFSSGATREDARRGMVRALRNLVIRGEIRTSSAYVLKLLETPAFRDADVSTGWLDKIIAKQSSEAPDTEGVYNALVAACIFRCYHQQRQMVERYITYLAAGHVPSSEYLINYRSEAYVRDTDKYIVSCGMVSESEFALALNGSILVVPFRLLKSGALQLTIAEKTMVAYVAEEPNNLRITIGGKSTNFSGALDPTKVMASVPGRLVRYLIEDGAHIEAGGTFAEVEVMKMILPIRVNVAGHLHHRSVAGSTISVGVLLAEITPDDPSKVSRPKVKTEKWPESFLEKRFERPDGVTRARRAIQTLYNLISGYHFKDMPMETRLQKAFNDLSSLSLSSVTLESLNISFVSTAHQTHVPSEKIKVIVEALLMKYIQMEQPFHARSREDAVTALKETGMESEKIFELDFGHYQPSHHDAVISILRYLEKNHTVLKLLEPQLAQLAALKSHAPGSLALHAKYLLRQAKLPSIMERKTEFAKELEHGVMSELVSSAYGYDLMCSIMFDRQYTHLIQVCMEMYIRRECLGEGAISSLDIFQLDSCWFAVYTYEALMVDDESSFDPSEEGFKKALGGGACVVFMDEQRFRSSFTQAFEKVLIHCATEASFVTILFSVSRDSSQSRVAEMVTEVLHDNRAALVSYRGLRTIYFMVYGMPDGPHMFTFTIKGTDFMEDTLLRNVRQQLTRRLELDRLSNYEVEMQPTPYKDVHLFKGTPIKASASALECRMFARVVVSANDMNMKPWTVATELDVGHMLTKCTAALEVARDNLGAAYPKSNHIFVKMVEITFDVSHLQELLTASAASFGDRLIALGITDVEISFQARVKTGFIQMRVLVDSPSRYQMNSHVYYETMINSKLYLYRAEFSEDVSVNEDSLVLDCHSPLVPQGHISHRRSQSKLEALRQMLPSKRPSENNLMSPTPNEHGSFPIGAPRIPFLPYQPLDRIAIKRLQAHANGTSYVEDWPLLFGHVIQNEWAKLCMSRGLPQETMPAEPLVTKRIYCCKEDPVRVTMDKASGAPECGVVAWLVEYYSAYYWDPETKKCTKRSFVLAANDITFSVGSMGVPEDNMFKAASAFARKERIPFIYASANSGARIGLCNEAKKKFLVDFNAKGELNYMYFTEEDYKDLCSKNISVQVEKKVTDSGETRYVLLGVSGAADDPIGVENLSGAGLMAGEMSRSYSEIPTVSIVSGRSVGIGAYLNRLGRRIIQTDDTPMILTGFKALNRLLGKDVYMDNSQLGGKKIMVPNGTTHFNTKHDYGSVKTAVQWLNFVPAICDMRRCSPRALTLPVEDPVDRDVTFTPVLDLPYDPRCLVRGTTESTGLFDRGSWMESMEGYAKTVVTGRATLGGIPCGIVLVETRHTKKHNPADPADPASASSFIVQAGQVWYSDSARKTAEAIDDFHHERLPVFIFANWRGFSGGSRDMFEEVLKFGASIVDNLRVSNTPVFIYIPPFGELRGGAWVVIDTKINDNGMIEMYCDSTSRGGILEASGIAEIKFRSEDVLSLLRRCHPELASMDPSEAAVREKQLFPRYSDAAVRFADLHDTHFRMTQKGAIHGVIPWVNSRREFHSKLVRKLKEMEIANVLVDRGEAQDLKSGLELVQKKCRAVHSSYSTASDAQKLEWLSALLKSVPSTKPSSASPSRESSVASVPAHRDPKSIGSSSDVDKLIDTIRRASDTGRDIQTCLADLFSKNPSIANAAAKALKKPK